MRPLPLGVALAACLALPASGQDAPLGGPPASESPGAESIIERAYDGSIKLPDGTIEEIALSRLGLTRAGASAEDAAAAGRIEAILARRGRLLEDFVFENVALLTKLDTAGKTGDKKDQVRLLSEGFRKLKSVREMGAMSDRIREALPPDHAARFDALLRAWWDAIAADRMARVKEDGKHPSRLEALAGARLEMFGKEIERSFERLLMSGEFIYRYATRGIELTPEQSRRLHAVIDEHYAKTKGADDEEANKRLFARSFAILNEDQRPRFVRNLRELGGEVKPRPEPKAKAPSDDQE